MIINVNIANKSFRWSYIWGDGWRVGWKDGWNDASNRVKIYNIIIFITNFALVYPQKIRFY